MADSGPLGVRADLQRVATGMDHLREPERYGDVMLSVQASAFHYCSPRRGDASTPLEYYGAVEIAMWWADRPRTPRSGGWITRPSVELGIDGFDDLWADDDVAGWVPLPRVGALQVSLADRAKRLARD